MIDDEWVGAHRNLTIFVLGLVIEVIGGVKLEKQKTPRKWF